MGCCKKNNDAQSCAQMQKKSEINMQAASDYLVCTCMGVMHQEILEAIDQGFDDFSKLSEKLGVGTGCSSCVAEVQEILASKKRSECCKS